MWVKAPSAARVSADAQLVCFGHAGAGASSFARWQQEAPAGVQIFRVQLPGREEGFGIPPPDDLRQVVVPIAAGIAEAVRVTIPVVLYGHSLGASLAHIVARHLLMTARGVCLKGLIVSARRAPHLPPPSPDLCDLDDADLLAEIDRAGGPSGLFTGRRMHPSLLALVRSDVAALNRVPTAQGSALDIPIAVFHGIRDVWVSEREAQSWAEATSAAFQLHRYDGGHFDQQSIRNRIMAEALLLGPADA